MNIDYLLILFVLQCILRILYSERVENLKEEANEKTTEHFFYGFEVRIGQGKYSHDIKIKNNLAYCILSVGGRK